MASVESGEPTSTATKSALPPPDRIDSATAAPFASSSSATTTVAPSAASARA